MKGAFIAIEGIDGCGKGTVLKSIAQQLYDADKNAHILLTREPYKRDWLTKFLSQLDPISQGEQALKLFVEDRANHCKMIEACLKKGIIVLSDRFKHSTYAYQMAQGIPFEKIHELHKPLLVPDLTIIADIPASEAVKRLGQTGKDHHAFHKEEFLTKVRDNYHKLKELLKENIIIIDGTKDRETVAAEAFKIVTDFMKRK
jgi:dTMP kinase